MSDDRSFRVIARAPASTLIRPDHQIGVSVGLDGQPLSVAFRTRYLERGYSSPAPGDLLLDAEGIASDLQAAARAFSNLGREIAAVISLSANAWIAPLEPEVVYETTPGLARREYFQRYLPPDEVAQTSRFVDTAATAEIVSALDRNAERDRLIRSIAQYSEALRNWRTGSELLALAHIYMGIEAITVARLRHELAKAEKDRQQLAMEWCFRDDGHQKIDAFLNSQTRERLVFKGDSESYQVAKEVSDHLEHGLSNAGRLVEKAGNAVIPTAGYLRQAILSVLDLSEKTLQVTLSANISHREAPTARTNTSGATWSAKVTLLLLEPIIPAIAGSRKSLTSPLMRA